MEENHKFSHMAIIIGFSLTGRIKPENSPAEADLNLDVKANDDGDLKLKCFSYKTEPDDLHTGKLRIGDNVRIRFHLGNDVDAVVNLEQKVKSVTPEPNLRGHTQHYIATGEIILIKPHPDKGLAKYYKKILLDCGIYVSTSIPVNSNFQVGDYIRTAGRLDGFVLEKVK